MSDEKYAEQVIPLMAMGGLDSADEPNQLEEREVYLMFRRMSARERHRIDNDKEDARWHHFVTRVILFNEDISHCDIVVRVGCQGVRHCKWKVEEGSPEDKSRQHRFRMNNPTAAQDEFLTRNNQPRNHTHFYHYIRVFSHDRGFDWRSDTSFVDEVAACSVPYTQGEEPNEERWKTFQAGDKHSYEAMRIHVTEQQYQDLVAYIMTLRKLDTDDNFTYDWCGLATLALSQRCVRNPHYRGCDSCASVNDRDIVAARDKLHFAVPSKLTCIVFALAALKNAGIPFFDQFSVTLTTPNELYLRCVADSDHVTRMNDIDKLGSKRPCLRLWHPELNTYIYPVVGDGKEEEPIAGGVDNVLQTPFSRRKVDTSEKKPTRVGLSVGRHSLFSSNKHQ